MVPDLHETTQAWYYFYWTLKPDADDEFQTALYCNKLFE